jgi:DNA integrity scanning protein DisA with diadenylate cyclase activity
MELGLTLLFRKGLTERIEGVSEDLKIKIARLEEGPDTSSQYQDLFNDIENNFRSLMSEYGVLSLDHPNGSFLADLSITLIDTLYREYFNEDALIRSFLFELKKKFNCEVCDFVEVEEDGDLLVWRIATVSSGDLSDEYQKKDIEDVRLLSRKHESYKKGQGISGSMLLIEDDPKTNFWHHIGSNDVPNDPRAAAHISHAYEQDVYPKVLQDGEIHNFWMFPIFLRTPTQQLKTDCETASSDRKLFGAFRVVNKLNSQGKLQPSGWPYITRLELSLIAGWFSKFFMALTPILQKSEEFAFISWGRLVDELIANTGLQYWIDRDFFSLILRHFARITFKKEEKRIMGSSVLIEENTNEAFAIGHPLVNYPGIGIGPNEIGYPYYNLDSYLDMVDPLNGVFIFDEKGVFYRIASLEYLNEDGHVVSGSETIRKITSGITRSIFILLPRDKRNILFYRDGEKVAELYFAERTGEWKFRSMRNIREILKNNSNLDPDVLNIIMETSLELSSRRWGGLIVLGDLSKDTFSYDESHTNFRVFTSITNIGTARLVDFVKLDGATIIDPSRGVKSVNKIIRPIEKRVELEIFKDRGGRHKTGEEICRLAPEALVVIISENGGISILKNGKALLKNG